MSNMTRHFFHLVDPSPWPFMTSIGAFALTNGGVLYFHGYSGGFYTLFFGLIFVTFCMSMWWSDVMREGTFEGHHTSVVKSGLVIGVILFMVSEMMFFSAFFWAFFHSSLAPVVEIGCIWPPMGIVPFNPMEMPFLNTMILLLSGATVTWAHHAMVAGQSLDAINALIFTILLALLFTGLQAYEYLEASFDISDGIYGSTFYMATGFHGFHVIIGTTFLAVCLYSLMQYHFTTTHHLGFEAAAWYWHFVDVVWLFLFVTVYYWGTF